tara:strand:- start:372 stop:611 length:240 start_codon:yes stop_codon:yes gene_type:complete
MSGVGVCVGDDVFVGGGVGIAMPVGVCNVVSLLSIFPGIPVGGTVIVLGIAGLTTIDESNALLAVVGVALSAELREPSS